MNSGKKFYWVLFAVFSLPIQASERHIDAAADCAAQMFVMTAAGKSVEGLDKYFEQQSGFINMILSLYMEKQMGKKVTNRMVSEIREAKLRRFESTNVSALTAESLSNCLGWSFSLAQTLQKNQGQSKQQLKNSILNGPKPNGQYDYPFNDAQQLPNWVSLAKQNWKTGGYMTPGKVREQLSK